MMQKLFLCCCSLALLHSCSEDNTLFRVVDSKQSNITFSNAITESDMINMINYQYLYNGGGVGIGDFNNDKLPDIYFTASLGSNKLYLNRGQLRFEDVTDKAGVDGEKRWSRGVSVVDINNDGLDDIYVCAAVWEDPDLRKNLFYINQGVDKSTGIPRFKEMAEAYGLADTTSTHMAAFFDYDNDGDLDVFLLENDLNQELPNTFREIKKDGSSPNTGKLFRNDWNKAMLQPVFHDVSREAGISWEGYGLGINILDINKDGWKDIYISNDYLSGDLLYINNQDGTFTNRLKEYIKHTSLNGMGNDAADINNDGLVDLVQMDMAAEDNYRSKMMMNPIDYNWYQYSRSYDFPYQVVRNTLQLNMGPRVTDTDSAGAPIFAEIAQFAGVAYTDWSWAALFADLDQDGFRDLMVTNGLPKDVTDLDFIAYRGQNATSTLNDLMQKLPAAAVSNYVFRNNGDLTFRDNTISWGWDFPTFSAGIATADFDNDGDLDVVINNTNMPAILLENTINEASEAPHNYLRLKFRGDTSNINGIGTIADIYCNGMHQSAELTPYRGYMSSLENVLHFGVGAAEMIDSVIITWPNGFRDVKYQVKANQELLLSRSSKAVAYAWPQPVVPADAWFSNMTRAAGIDFFHQQQDFVDFYVQRSLPHKFSQNGPALASGDINGDKLEDFITGGNNLQPAIIHLQQADHTFDNKTLPQDTVAHYDQGICLFDADGDNDLDLYIGSGGYEFQKGSPQMKDRFFVNDGAGNFTPVPGALPPNSSSTSCVKAADIEGDGDIDLFVGERVIPGQYPMPCSGTMLINESTPGKPVFRQTIPAGMQHIGMVTDALWSDVDNDDDPDLLVTGEWMGIIVFNNDHGKLVRQPTALDAELGWWNSLSAADIDNDGDMDYVAGNMGLNSLFRATATEPVNVYAADYDKNGHIDFMMSHWRAISPHGEKAEFPANYRDLVAEELPAIKKFYNNYSLYAKAGMNDVFSNFSREKELKLSVTNLHSIWIENKGEFNFVVHTFPANAQWSPVFGILPHDFNQDGNLDLFMCGNDFAMAPVLGRQDALNGLLLQGDGKGAFTAILSIQAGVFLPGNAKSIVQVPLGDTYALICAQNSGPLEVFRNKKTATPVQLQADEVAVLLQLSNGQTRKQEYYYGSGYLSQSSRYVYQEPGVSFITIRNKTGTTRTIK